MILLDDKQNRWPFHLQTIKRGLNIRLQAKLSLPRLVSNVEPRQSSGPKAEPLIQIVDLLIGAIGYVRNNHILAEGAMPSKIAMVRSLEKMAGTEFKYDTTSRAPFNIFTFDVAKAMTRKQDYLEKAKMNRSNP